MFLVISHSFRIFLLFPTLFESESDLWLQTPLFDYNRATLPSQPLFSAPHSKFFSKAQPFSGNPVAFPGQPSFTGLWCAPCGWLTPSSQVQLLLFSNHSPLLLFLVVVFSPCDFEPFPYVCAVTVCCELTLILYSSRSNFRC